MATAQTQNDRWPLAIFSGVFTLIGCGALAAIWFALLAPAYDARDRFVEAEGEVVATRIEEDLRDGASYFPEFELRYTPADRDVLTSWGYRQPRESLVHHAEALEVLDRYPVGRVGPVWYDPQDPGKVVIEHDVPWYAPLFLLIPLPFLIIGLAGFASLVRRPAVPKESSSPDLLLAVLGVVFLLGGIVSLPVLIFAWALPEYRLNTEWVEAECEVLDGRILSVQGKKQRLYHPEIKIRYQAAGQPQPYELWTWRLNHVSTSDRASQQAILDRYPRGAKVPCWYDPARPRWAVLERDVSWFFSVLLLLPIIFTSVGVLMLWLFVKWRPRQAGEAGLRAHELGPDDPPLDARGA